MRKSHNIAPRHHLLRKIFRKEIVMNLKFLIILLLLAPGFGCERSHKASFAHAANPSELRSLWSLTVTQQRHSQTTEIKINSRGEIHLRWSGSDRDGQPFQESVIGSTEDFDGLREIESVATSLTNFPAQRVAPGRSYVSIKWTNQQQILDKSWDEAVNSANMAVNADLMYRWFYLRGLTSGLVGMSRDDDGNTLDAIYRMSRVLEE